MNIKAERIEHLIQLINRNLQLVLSGQNDIVPVEHRPLQKVDAVIFGQDKFAYEMVYFLTSAKEKLDNIDQSVFFEWESNFVLGLESLLVECAVISDEIERDCFISRVYCWFTEKLSERREVPRKSNITVEDLKKSVARFTDTGEHTMKALNSFDPNSVVDHRGKLMHEPEDPRVKFGPSDGKTLPPINVRLQAVYPEGMKKIPSYVKHNYPSVLPNQRNDPDTSFLPRIPGNEENYGMLYNKPETEAEKKMNDLWLARRRQEAFDYKTQQQLAIVMDRLALHKARLESDALRKQETETMLKFVKKPRPNSANDALGGSSRPVTSTNDTSSLASATGGPGRYRGIAQKLLKGENDSPLASPERKHNRSLSPKDKARHSKDNNNTQHSRSQKSLPAADGEGNVTISINDGEKESTINNPARTGVLKGGKRVYAPMKFKTSLPDGYAERQQYYMQLSDSDDDDKPDRPARALHSSSVNRTGGGGKKKGGGGNNIAKIDIHFKHEAPIVRERPASAKQFRAIALNDPEIKVHYRHTNYRRMPLTSEQEQWLQEREVNRTKKSEDIAKQLFETFQAKNDKKKDKDGKEGKQKKDNAKDAKSRPGTAKSATAGNEPGTQELKKKYKSATQFMAVHFPNFENDEELEKMAPMRRMQLIEVAEVMQTCEDYKVGVKEATLKKALVVPQDRPEAICLENLRGEKDGLLQNPNPAEYWRKMVIKKGGGKKGKKKKK